MTRIVVLGGTGTLGRVVTDRLVAAGHQVRITSRRPEPAGDARPYEWATVELRGGTGLDAALHGADAVVYAANVRRDAEAVATLLTAARRAGTPHLVYVSIVGIDRVPFSYYRQKLTAERLIEESGLPHTILRATQFHDLIRPLLAGTSRLPVMPLPDLPFQPVDVHDVADRLVELAVAAPAGRVTDLGGPRVQRLPDLAAIFGEVTGTRRAIWRIRLPGRMIRAIRDGALTAPGGAVGTLDFADYMAAHTDPRGLSYRARS